MSLKCFKFWKIRVIVVHKSYKTCLKMDVVPLLCQTTVCHIVRVTLLFYTSLLSGQVIGQESVSLARYLQRTDCRVKQGKVSSSYIASSLEHCTALCKNSPPCVTASWNSRMSFYYHVHTHKSYYYTFEIYYLFWTLKSMFTG